MSVSLATARAYAVHLYTASGVLFAFLAAAELLSRDPDARWVFAWLAVTLVIDATDGPVARAWEVKRYAPRIDGRTIDDLLDYLTFTFLPLLLVWRMGWLGAWDWIGVPGVGLDGLLVALAMLASLLGFANTQAKQEEKGFFQGFPSYWNIYAFYAGLWWVYAGPWPGLIVLAVLTVLTVSPVRFIYPNLAPRPWRTPLNIACTVWLVLVLGMLPWYPRDVPVWLMWLSLIVPIGYGVLSIWLDFQDRQSDRRA